MKKMLRVFLTIAGVFSAGTLLAATETVKVTPVITGTAHEALFAIAFDDKAGLAVGAGGAILNTEDGGKTWKPAAPLTELSLLGADARQSRQVAVGQMGTILVKDGAAPWKKMVSGTEARLFAVSANASGQMAAVGSFGAVVGSTDGGQTWKSIAPEWTADKYKGLGGDIQGFQPHLFAVKVGDDGSITVAGELGLIFRSTDGGAQWNVIHKAEGTAAGTIVPSIFALDLRADGNGYAVGQDGFILRTEDNGKTWINVDSGTKAILLGVYSNPDGQVVIGGMHEMLMSHDGGKSFQLVNNPEVKSAWYQGVARAGSNSVFVAGHSGRIVRIGD